MKEESLQVSVQEEGLESLSRSARRSSGLVRDLNIGV